MKRTGFLTTLLLLVTVTGALAISESQKITALLNAIEQSNLVFIRNGTEYSAPRAREHLEMKLSRSGGRITTAAQFIEHLASRSSMTGTPYYVKLPDGRRMRAAVWLREKLAEIERGERKVP
jgi:hypothetical protein